MRGNLVEGQREIRILRSIPAYAGEPGVRFRPNRALRVYPRVCGGTPVCGIFRLSYIGLSPRMRGNRGGRLYRRLCDRSIPAYAGEPRPYTTQTYSVRVYPRVCGGTPAAQYSGNTAPGLSPRMRGNQYAGTVSPDEDASIPAYAGEPAHPPPRRQPTAVMRRRRQP